MLGERTAKKSLVPCAFLPKETANSISFQNPRFVLAVGPILACFLVVRLVSSGGLTAALVMGKRRGFGSGVICYWGTTGLKHALGYDDSLDAFGVHGVGGAVGALLTGVLAVAWVGAKAKATRSTSRSGCVSIQT